MKSRRHSSRTWLIPLSPTHLLLFRYRPNQHKDPFWWHRRTGKRLRHLRRIQAAITFDSNAASGNRTGTTYSFNHTLGTGSNGCIVVGVIVKDSSSTNRITGVTYNGTAMTAAYAEIFFSTGRIHLRQFYLATSLAAGTYSVAVTLAGNAQGSKAAASSYFGVDQTTPLDAAGSGANGTSTGPSVSITTVNNNAMIVDLLMQNATNSETATSPQADPSTDIGVIPGFGKSDKTLATAGATTMSWTLGASAQWGINAMSLKPAAGAAAAQPGSDDDGHLSAIRLFAPTEEAQAAWATSAAEDAYVVWRLSGILAYAEDDASGFVPPPAVVTQPSAEDDFVYYLAGWPTYDDGFVPPPPLVTPSAEDDFSIALMGLSRHEVDESGFAPLAPLVQPGIEDEPHLLFARSSVHDEPDVSGLSPLPPLQPAGYEDDFLFAFCTTYSWREDDLSGFAPIVVLLPPSGDDDSAGQQLMFTYLPGSLASLVPTDESGFVVRPPTVLVEDRLYLEKDAGAEQGVYWSPRLGGTF